MFDGIIARRLGMATPALRRLDSVADTVFYVGATCAVWRLQPAAIITHLRGLLALVALELARYTLDLVKFRRETSYHTWSAKGWGIALFLAFLAVLAFGRTGWPVSVAVALGIVADLEGLAISLVLPGWRHDVPSVVHAVCVRSATRTT